MRLVEPDTPRARIRMQSRWLPLIHLGAPHGNGLGRGPGPHDADPTAPHGLLSLAGALEREGERRGVDCRLLRPRLPQIANRILVVRGRHSVLECRPAAIRAQCRDERAQRAWGEPFGYLTNDGD